MVSTGGNEIPPVRIKLTWGLSLGALGLDVMRTGDVKPVRAIIALGCNLPSAGVSGRERMV
ncbi:hypothetical protein [Thiorhodococcus minor]|uniref:Uncharacterized protein n=1 Tax=Thiorhodococcus minor TaxID=57489 RepID=A0A6M0K4Z3_9GAMM|nr:hypothetical protein [Thiorhodococcus minor]NEV63993.1 hypothetical protein [Thiorhodococcus minor]